MKISRNWLQKYFEDTLPDAKVLANALTFHAFEIESIVKIEVKPQSDEVLDVKVTPNRGHDCLCHFGVAKEISAILQIPRKKYLHTMSLDDIKKTTDKVSVVIAEKTQCFRYIAGYIKNVKVGPSPEWLRNSLESIGQKSINNIVDATNYVMFDIGQPLHAFDAAKLQGSTLSNKVEPCYVIRVRLAKKGEEMMALDDKEYALSESMLVITDGNAGVPVGIAGVKGGKPAGITEATTDIVIEAANFDGVSVRRTAAALKLRTDASSRFEQVLSPELAAYGMRAAAELIVELAGGEIVGFADEYPVKQQRGTVSVTLAKINTVLGTTLKESDIVDAFKRLDLPFEQKGEAFTVTPPFERLDLVIPEDLVEEVARIIGYDKIPATSLPAPKQKPDINADFYAAERIREELKAKGYSEVFTSVFADKGERAVLNKVGGEKPYLRTNLADNLGKAMFRNLSNKELLGLKKVKLFEIGTIWKGGEEKVNVATLEGEGSSNPDAWSGEEVSLQPVNAAAYDDLSVSSTERYQSFSKYPFIVRDIALWVPKGTDADAVLSVIRNHAGDLLVRSEKFDEFQKGDRTSFAFHLVFQSFDRTLTDEDAKQRMDSVYEAVKAKGWQVR